MKVLLHDMDTIHCISFFPSVHTLTEFNITDTSLFQKQVPKYFFDKVLPIIFPHFSSQFHAAFCGHHQVYLPGCFSSPTLPVSTMTTTGQLIVWFSSLDGKELLKAFQQRCCTKIFRDSIQQRTIIHPGDKRQHQEVVSIVHEEFLNELWTWQQRKKRKEERKERNM